MAKTTELEREVLRGIIDSDFHDAQDPIGNWVWSWSCNPWMETEDAKKFSGVVTSLIKKGLAESDGGEGEDACLTITQAGWDAIKTA